MSDDQDHDERRDVRKTFIRVMIVQLITLALLWLLQSRYAG